MTKLLGGITFQPPPPVSGGSGWWGHSSLTVVFLSDPIPGDTCGVGGPAARTWAGRAAFRRTDRRDRKRKVHNTKTSLVLVCAAFRSCWETGTPSRETMTTTPRAVDESLSEVNQAVNIQLWPTIMMLPEPGGTLPTLWVKSFHLSLLLINTWFTDHFRTPV